MTEAAPNFETMFFDIITGEFCMLPEKDTKDILDQTFEEFERINRFNKNYLKNLDSQTRFFHIKQLIRIFVNRIITKCNLDKEYETQIFSRLLTEYKEKYFK
jgi:hypothetical protein